MSAVKCGGGLRMSQHGRLGLVECRNVVFVAQLMSAVECSVDLTVLNCRNIGRCG